MKGGGESYWIRKLYPCLFHTWTDLYYVYDTATRDCVMRVCQKSERCANIIKMEIWFLVSLYVCYSKVIILLSNQINLSSRFWNLLSSMMHENFSFSLLLSFVGRNVLSFSTILEKMPRRVWAGIMISELNWIVNKLDIEAKIFGQKSIVDKGVDVAFLRSAS